VLGVLYHVSIADRHKEQFALTDCIAVAMQLLLGNQDTSPVLMALCVNLTCCSKNADVICGNNGLKLLMKREWSTHFIIITLSNQLFRQAR
jgi:hypothetical protein